MIGAIAGDIIGSRFEGHSAPPAGFELFHPHCRFTDDVGCTDPTLRGWVCPIAQISVAGFSLGEESLPPCSWHYLPETLYGRPLARVRDSVQDLGIETAHERSEPEDHAAILCDIMAGLADCRHHSACWH